MRIAPKQRNWPPDRPSLHRTLNSKLSATDERLQILALPPLIVGTVEDSYISKTLFTPLQVENVRNKTDDFYKALDKMTLSTPDRYS